MLEEWPFDEPENVAVFTVRQIVREGAPILHVTHGSDDGAWQFLEWETPREEDAMIVALSEVFEMDPSVAALADLPMGWHAWRSTGRGPWIREPNPHEDDEETT